MADKPLVNMKTDSESIISMVLGAMVVVVIGALLFSYIRDWRSRQATTPNNENAEAETTTPVVVEELPKPEEVELITTESGEKVPADLPAQYTVKAGDSTWKIAEAFYGSGFNYVDIEKSNNLKPNQELSVGMELIVPRTAVRTKETAARPSTVTAQPGKATTAVGPAKGDDRAAQAELQKTE